MTAAVSVCMGASIEIVAIKSICFLEGQGNLLNKMEPSDSVAKVNVNVDPLDNKNGIFHVEDNSRHPYLKNHPRSDSTHHSKDS